MYFARPCITTLFCKELIIMKPYIKPKLIFLFFTGAIIILAAFEHDTAFPTSLTPVTGSVVSQDHIEDRPGREIPLPPNETIEAFAYNAVKNSLCAISHAHRTYRLYSLGQNGSWNTPLQWNVSPDEELLHFVYDPDGKLYACRKTTRGKKSRQSLVRLHKNGRITSIILNDLEKVPKTSYDKNRKAKGIRNPHDITDIRFSGTALAITYRSHAVKFYNIAEGQALGPDSVTGAAGQNIFYDLHYLSPGTSTNSDMLQLNYYDIRTGETEYTADIPSSSRHTIWLANYRDNVCLLTSNGLYTGTCTDKTFTRKLSFILPSGIRILSLQAARDDVIYIAWMDEEDAPHLTSLTAPV